MIWKILFIFFAYLYASSEGWTEGRMCKAQYDKTFKMNWNRYHFVRWFLETGGIVGMVICASRINLSVLAGIFLFISAIPLYEGCFRIARKDTWFYTKVSKWLFGIPHISWQAEAVVFVTTFLFLTLTI